MMLPTSESGQGLCIPAHSISTREEVRWAGLFLKSERLERNFQPLTFFQMLSCHDSDTVSGDLSDSVLHTGHICPHCEQHPFLVLVLRSRVIARSAEVW